MKFLEVSRFTKFPNYSGARYVTEVGPYGLFPTNLIIMMMEGNTYPSFGSVGRIGVYQNIFIRPPSVQRYEEVSPHEPHRTLKNFLSGPYK